MRIVQKPMNKTLDCWEFVQRAFCMRETARSSCSTVCVIIYREISTLCLNIPPPLDALPSIIQTVVGLLVLIDFLALSRQARQFHN